MSDQVERPALVRLSEGLGEARCMCKDRALSACPGEWEPGCDMGNNPGYVRAALVAEAAKTATDPGGYAWVPVQMSMEDADDDWRPC